MVKPGRSTYRASVTSRSSGLLSKPSFTARAFPVEASNQSGEGCGLRKSHDGPTGKRRTMSIVSVGDPADGVPQNLDCRLGDVLVVVSRAGFAQVLEQPGPLAAGLEIRFRLDSRQAAQSDETRIRPRPSSKKDGRIGLGIRRQDAPKMSMDRTVQWSVKGLARLLPAIVEPAPGRSLLDLPIWALAAPGYVSPEDRRVVRR